MTRRQASAARPNGSTRSNLYPGPCAVCRVFVDRGQGAAVLVDGRWTVRCQAHAAGQPIAPPAPADTARPYVSEAARDAAVMMARTAERDRNHGAAAIAWELVAAACYCRGEEGGVGDALAARESVTDRRIAAKPTAPTADDLVAEMLARGGHVEAAGSIQGGKLRIVYSNDPTGLARDGIAPEGAPECRNTFSAAMADLPADHPARAKLAAARDASAEITGRKLTPPRPAPAKPAPRKDRWAHRKAPK